MVGAEKSGPIKGQFVKAWAARGSNAAKKESVEKHVVNILNRRTGRENAGSRLCQVLNEIGNVLVLEGEF